MQINLQQMDWQLAVCKLSVPSNPHWAEDSLFLAWCKTPDETSLVCESKYVPSGQKAETGWGAFKVEGALDFALIGIIARISSALADAQISVFVVSTFDTDYVLVKQAKMQDARAALMKVGCEFIS